MLSRARKGRLQQSSVRSTFACRCNTELRSSRVLRERIRPSPTEEPCDNAVGAGFSPIQS